VRAVARHPGNAGGGDVPQTVRDPAHRQLPALEVGGEHHLVGEELAFVGHAIGVAIASGLIGNIAFVRDAVGVAVRFARVGHSVGVAIGIASRDLASVGHPVRVAIRFADVGNDVEVAVSPGSATLGGPARRPGQRIDRQATRVADVGDAVAVAVELDGGEHVGRARATVRRRRANHRFAVADRHPRPEAVTGGRVGCSVSNQRHPGRPAAFVEIDRTASAVASRGSDQQLIAPHGDGRAECVVRDAGGAGEFVHLGPGGPGALEDVDRAQRAVIVGRADGCVVLIERNSRSESVTPGPVGGDELGLLRPIRTVEEKYIRGSGVGVVARRADQRIGICQSQRRTEQILGGIVGCDQLLPLRPARPRAAKDEHRSRLAAAIVIAPRPDQQFVARQGNRDTEFVERDPAARRALGLEAPAVRVARVDVRGSGDLPQVVIPGRTDDGIGPIGCDGCAETQADPAIYRLHPLPKCPRGAVALPGAQPAGCDSARAIRAGGDQYCIGQQRDGKSQFVGTGGDGLGEPGGLVQLDGPKRAGLARDPGQDENGDRPMSMVHVDSPTAPPAYQPSRPTHCDADGLPWRYRTIGCLGLKVGGASHAEGRIAVRGQPGSESAALRGGRAGVSRLEGAEWVAGLGSSRIGELPRSALAARGGIMWDRLFSRSISDGTVKQTDWKVGPT
jgi:hypothetical protein